LARRRQHRDGSDRIKPSSFEIGSKTSRKNYRTEGSNSEEKRSKFPPASRLGPPKKCTTCIAGNASCVGTAHREPSFLLWAFRWGSPPEGSNKKILSEAGLLCQSFGEQPFSSHSLSFANGHPKMPVSPPHRGAPFEVRPGYVGRGRQASHRVVADTDSAAHRLISRTQPCPANPESCPKSAGCDSLMKNNVRCCID